jgi:hypothetical protein
MLVVRKQSYPAQIAMLTSLRLANQPSEVRKRAVVLLRHSHICAELVTTAGAAFPFAACKLASGTNPEAG